MRKYLVIICLTVMAFTYCDAQSHPIDVGSKCPLFSLQDQDGKTFNMKDSIGNNIFVIFFYPKDASPVCTKEACTFRDSMDFFKEMGVQVIGINQGDVKSHKKFQEDSHLTYELLSDPDKTVIKQFGVRNGLLDQRVAFVVDITGQIVFECSSTLDGAKHVREALAFVRQMKKKQAGSPTGN